MEKGDKQQLLLEYLISSADTFALCKSIVKSNYFDPEFRQTVDFIHTYYDQFNATPNPDQIIAETSLKLTKRDVTKDEIEYCSQEIEKFCRRKAIESVILAAPGMINKGQSAEIETLIQDALAISLNRDLGIDYFNKPEDRLEELAKTPLRTPTNWNAFDDLLNGGIARTEIILFSANSGGGKSITLANLAINMLNQGFNVLYLSLELSEQLVAQRFDTMFTGVPSVIWQQKHKEIASSLNVISKNMGKLTIKWMPSGTSSAKIRGYLKEFELKNKYIPDVLIVDYLDIMGANEFVSADNISEKDKRATEQLRNIGFDYNMYIITAAQQNRCLALDTIVETDKGELQIKDVIVGDKLFDGITFNTVTEVLPISRQKTYLITTKLGNKIICSGNHKFPLCNNTLGTINDNQIKVGTKLLSKIK